MTTWLDSFGPISVNAALNFPAYTARWIIQSAYLSNKGLGKVRVTFEAYPANVLKILKAFIGEAAASGDPYDFEATPTQLLFAGSPSINSASGGQVVSDEAMFSISASKNLIVSLYNDATSGYLGVRAAQPGCTMWYKAGDDAAIVNASGYSGGPGIYDYAGVMRIESAAGWPGLFGLI